MIGWINKKVLDNIALFWAFFYKVRTIYAENWDHFKHKIQNRNYVYLIRIQKLIVSFNYCSVYYKYLIKLGLSI